CLGAWHSPGELCCLLRDRRNGSGKEKGTSNIALSLLPFPFSLFPSKSASPAKPDAEARLAFAVGARDFRKPVQISNRAIRIELQVRDVATRVVEVGGVEEIEYLESNLHVGLARQHDLPEEAEVPVSVARSAHGAPGRGAESSFGDRLEGQGIEVGVAATDAAEDLHLRLHLVGTLRTLGGVERCAGRRDVKRQPAPEADQVV